MVAVAAFLAFTGEADALVTPQPLSPEDGASLYVGAGLTTLEFSGGENPTEEAQVEASLSAATGSEGEFVDPPIATEYASPTGTPGIDAMTLRPLDFEAGGRLFNGSASGTVYWRPSAFGCEARIDEPDGFSVPVTECARKRGAMRSFSFTTIRPSPAPEAVGRIEIPASVKPTRLAGAHVVGSQAFAFHLDVSSCRGPRLKLIHVRLVEKPENEDGLEAAIVTAYLFHPSHVEGGPCSKVRRIRRVRIRTKRPADDLVFFDGSSSPPRRVFPLHDQATGDQGAGA